MHSLIDHSLLGSNIKKESAIALTMIKMNEFQVPPVYHEKLKVRNVKNEMKLMIMMETKYEDRLLRNDLRKYVKQFQVRVLFLSMQGEKMNAENKIHGDIIVAKDRNTAIRDIILKNDTLENTRLYFLYVEPNVWIHMDNLYHSIGNLPDVRLIMKSERDNVVLFSKDWFLVKKELNESVFDYSEDDVANFIHEPRMNMLFQQNCTEESIAVHQVPYDLYKYPQEIAKLCPSQPTNVGRPYHAVGMVLIIIVLLTLFIKYQIRVLDQRRAERYKKDRMNPFGKMFARKAS